MQLTCAMSQIKKYKTLPRVATGRNSSRVVFIFISVSLATVNFSFTSAAVCLVLLSTDINSKSSIKGPCKIDEEVKSSFCFHVEKRHYEILFRYKPEQLLIYGVN